AQAGVDKARDQVAGFLNCDSGEIVFTSGATESDNMAIRGVMEALQEKGVKNMHVITSLVEHDAVLEPCAALQKEGVEITHINVKKNGVIDLENFKKSLRDNTVLVSIMWVNSEVGAIMPIREIGKIIKKHNEKREREWKKLSVKERGERPRAVLFHTDATQAVNFTQCDVKWNYIDLLSLSAHKIYGPKGVGALYCKQGTPLIALQKGGHHENNLRSGTLNVTGIVGLGAAIAQITKKDKTENNKYVGKLRDMLVAGIKKNIPDTFLNTDRENSTPSHAHYSFIGVEGEASLMALDLEHGIAVSTGSACASGSLKASHVLIAMGIKKEIAHNSIRFTLGKHNSEEDIRKVIKVLPPIIKKYRDMNPLYNN
ncbi:cysteine desulfurase, partial [bacterium]|nr:cysteine desulfurase [bacterium]